MNIKRPVKHLIKGFHTHNKSLPDIYIFSLPRSGSTLLTEVLNSNLKSKTASESLGLNKDNKNILKQYFSEDFISERYVDISPDDFQQILAYYSALSQGKTWNSFYWSDLFTKYHSYSTSRTIFKTHKITYHFDELMNNFGNDYGIYLLRNPIAVSLSRIRMGWCNYIDQYEDSLQIKDFISQDLKSVMKEIKQNGTELEKQVLSWCLENSIFIKNWLNNSLPKNVITVFYEDLILNPKKTLLRICSKIDMEYHPNMLKIIDQPSSGIIHSQKEVKKEILTGNSLYLTERWKNEIDSKSLNRIENLLRKFGFDFYLT